MRLRLRLIGPADVEALFVRAGCPGTVGERVEVCFGGGGVVEVEVGCREGAALMGEVDSCVVVVVHVGMDWVARWRRMGVEVA